MTIDLTSRGTKCRHPHSHPPTTLNDPTSSFKIIKFLFKKLKQLNATIKAILSTKHHSTIYLLSPYLPDRPHILAMAISDLD